MVASLAAGLHAAVIIVGRRLGVMLPTAFRCGSTAPAPMAIAPALRDMQAARQGLHGIPYASLLAITIGWVRKRLWSVA
jgi:prepilin peptidase CpaA